MQPPKLRWIVLCCIAQAALLAGALPQEPDPTRGSLIVEVETLDLEKGSVAFRLINNTPQPLTALAYQVVVLYKDGSRHQETLYFEAIYSAYLPRPDQIPLLHSGAGPIWPGQAVAYTRPLQRKPDTGFLLAYIEPQAVVMLDRQAIGEAHPIRRIAEGRQAFFAALDGWLPRFEQTLAATLSGADAAGELRKLVNTMKATSTSYDSLSPGQRSIARTWERKLSDYAEQLLEFAERGNAPSIERHIARRLESYRAQLMAAQDAWKLTELKENEQ